MIDFKKKAEENECQYLWRIKGAVDSGEITWRAVTPTINEELFGDDVEQYRDESAYRKRVRSAEEFLTSGVFMFSEEDYLKRLADERRELAIAQTKFRDERNAWSRQGREAARVEARLDYLEQLITETSPYSSPAVRTVGDGMDKDILICISDVHMGLNTGDTLFGAYNSEIAKRSFDNYYECCREIIESNNIRNAYIAVLGDNVNGNIHYTTILENGENVISQIQSVSELISEFIYNISKLVCKVFVNDVGGNHSRLGKKNEVLRNERLDSIVLWYCKAKLANVGNVAFLDDECKYDPTLAFFNIRGFHFLLCHGDFDGADASGVQKLAMLVGEIPYAIIIGHRHSTAYSEISGVKVIQSGTFAGSGSNYCIERRLIGSPSQAVAIIGDGGIEAFYPVQIK